MKKFLSLLTATVLTAGAGTAVVACNKNEKKVETPKEDDKKDEEKNKDLDKKIDENEADKINPKLAEAKTLLHNTINTLEVLVKDERFNDTERILLDIIISTSKLTLQKSSNIEKIYEEIKILNNMASKLKITSTPNQKQN